MTNAISGQLSFDFGEPPLPEPGACAHEVKRWRDKSLCDVRGTEVWTNCREWGSCTLAHGGCISQEPEEDEEWDRG